MRLDSLFMFLIQQDSVGCNSSGGFGVREEKDCDVRICSLEEDGVLVRLTRCWLSVDNSCWQSGINCCSQASHEDRMYD